MREACGRTALAERAFFRVTNRGQGRASTWPASWPASGERAVRRQRRPARRRRGVSEVLAFAWDADQHPFGSLIRGSSASG